MSFKQHWNEIFNDRGWTKLCILDVSATKLEGIEKFEIPEKTEQKNCENKQGHKQ